MTPICGSLGCVAKVPALSIDFGVVVKEQLYNFLMTLIYYSLESVAILPALSVDFGLVIKEQLYNCLMAPICYSPWTLYGAPPGIVQRERQGITRNRRPLRAAGFNYRETYQVARADDYDNEYVN
jgi:hypothetical protein